mmetsp:Transcript_23702/g.57166  ORF Transcript_23702/g.57166 Transcript_23702/m.57166 type:complete len:204 (+) Transcript_23702:297-908(+)
MMHSRKTFHNENSPIHLTTLPTVSSSTLANWTPCGRWSPGRPILMGPQPKRQRQAPPQGRYPQLRGSDWACQREGTTRRSACAPPPHHSMRHTARRHHSRHREQAALPLPRQALVRRRQLGPGSLPRAPPHFPDQRLPARRSTPPIPQSNLTSAPLPQPAADRKLAVHTPVDHTPAVHTPADHRPAARKPADRTAAAAADLHC